MFLEGMMDSIIIIIIIMQKLEHWAKKCIEHRGKYIEEIPSLVAVVCFLPSRTKDLTAPPHNSLPTFFKGHEIQIFLDFLTLEDGTDRFS